MAAEHGPVRGQGSEPVAVLRGKEAHDAAFEAEAEQWAWRRMRSIRAFYVHLTAFSIVNIVIITIDYITPGSLFFFFPLLTWGLIVGLHAAHTYERLPWFTRDWEQRKVQDLIEERRRQRQ